LIDWVHPDAQPLIEQLGSGYSWALKKRSLDILDIIETLEIKVWHMLYKFWLAWYKMAEPIIDWAKVWVEERKL